jgi:hypothetical protein
MRKINTRGIEQANKVMLMAASAYNLKKLMKHIEKHRKVAAMVIKKEIIKQVENCVLIFNVFYTAVKDTIKYTTLDIQKCTTPGNKFLLNSSGKLKPEHNVWSGNALHSKDPFRKRQKPALYC